MRLLYADFSLIRNLKETYKNVKIPKEIINMTNL